MKIEVGKYYRLRDGRKAYVTGRQNDNPFTGQTAIYPWCGFAENDDADYSWTESGLKWADSEGCDDGDDGGDIVGEWNDDVKVPVTAVLLDNGETETFEGHINTVDLLLWSVAMLNQVVGFRYHTITVRRGDKG